MRLSEWQSVCLCVGVGGARTCRRCNADKLEISKECCRAMWTTWIDWQREVGCSGVWRTGRVCQKCSSEVRCLYIDVVHHCLYLCDVWFDVSVSSPLTFSSKQCQTYGCEGKLSFLMVIVEWDKLWKDNRCYLASNA